MAVFRVRYVGLSDVRELTVQQLAAVGVGVGDDLVWGPHNRKAVYVENPSDALLERFKMEGTFSVQEIDQESGIVKPDSEPIVKGVRSDDTGPTVVDGNTGQTSVKPAPTSQQSALANLGKSAGDSDKTR